MPGMGISPENQIGVLEEILFINCLFDVLEINLFVIIFCWFVPPVNYPLVVPFKFERILLEALLCHILDPTVGHLNL